MNMNQFTQKTVEALQRAQALAIEYQHMQVEQEHLMTALLEDKNGLISQLLQKMGLNVEGLRKAVTDSLSRIPRVSGPGRKPIRFIFRRTWKKPCWKPRTAQSR